MPARALRSPTVRAHVTGESASSQCNNMGEELPILKGILNGVVNYHNARRCLWCFRKKLIFQKSVTKTNGFLSDQESTFFS